MISELYRTHHPRSEVASTELAKHSPSLWGLLLWIAHVDTPDAGTKTYTDGKTIWYGTDFDTLDIKTQIFVMAHELLHVALCHPMRGDHLRRREGDHAFSLPTWTIACDAQINQMLESSCYGHDAWMTAHPNTVTLIQINGALSNAGWEGTLNELDAEGLYYLLKQYPKALDGLEYALDDDIVINGGSDPEDQHDTQAWAQRLDNAAIGDRPGGILRTLTQRPSVFTPWERTLRSDVATSVTSTTVDSWARPSRRWLALHRRPWNIPYLPGVTSKPLPTFGVIIDSSGSIGDDLFTRFIAEIHGIRDRTGARLIVMIADAAVQSTTVVGRNQDIDRITFTGGGGTDFAPALAAMAEYAPAHVVYLTDLAGHFPEIAPKFRVTWAVPSFDVKPGMAVPFGKILILK